MNKHLATLTLLTFALAVPTFAVVYVDQNSPGPQHNGSTWDKACLTIQEGIDAAEPGEEVWVADGVYVENLNMAEGVKMYGGFLGAEEGGYESSRDDRNFVQNLTVIDGGGEDNCVLMFVGGAVVDGFVVTNGYSSYGAAFYCDGVDAETIIANNMITGNSVYGQGGAIACIYTAPLTVTNNIIVYNSADEGGGAVFCFGTSPTFTNNAIAYNSSSMGSGGAVLTSYHCNPTFDTNLFFNNTADLHGGAICSPTGMILVNNVIVDNTASYGSGGGMFFEVYASAVTNNTIVGNEAGADGGGLCSLAAILTVENNIFSENSCGGSGGGIFCDVMTIADLSCNNVWNNSPDDYSGVAPGAGDISVDPEFVDADARDYHLSYESLCIDAGDNSADYLPSLDWDSEGRIAKTTVDIGADEFTTYLVTAPDPQPECDGALFGEPQSGFPGWVWFSIPMTPALDPDPNGVLGIECKGKLYKYDKYIKAPIVYQPPFSEWDLAVGDGYLFWLDIAVSNPSYDGLSPFTPWAFEFKLGRQGWTWIGMPGMNSLGGDDFMGSVMVKYPSDDSGAFRTAGQDYGATPDNWITWGWPYWNTWRQATETFTPYAPFGHKDCYPWVGYRVWIRVGTATEADDPDQVTLIWPRTGG